MYFYKGEKFKFFMPYYSYWYLLSLIYWRIIIIYIDVENKKSAILKTFAFTLISGYSGSFSNNIFSIRRTIAFFPFFLLGYLFPKEKFKELTDKINSPFKKLKVFIFFIAYSLGVYYCIKKRIIEFSKGELLMAQYINFYDIKKRLLLFILALIMLFSLLLVMPNRKIPFFSMAGRNSLYIYFFHRIFPIIFRDRYGPKLEINKILLYGFIETIIIMIVFGNDFVTQKISQFINYIYSNLSKNTKEGKKIKLICLGIVFYLILLNPVKNHIKRMNPKPRSIIRVQPNTNVKKQSPSKIIPKKDTAVNNKFLNNIQGNTSLSQNIVKENIPNIKLNYSITHILTDELKQKLNSSIRISYVGDLILLKQQVISAFN
jgi:hypothetical protein